MHLTYRCPACQQPQRVDVSDVTERLHCPACGWNRALPRREAREDGESASPACLVCACGDLWRQKNFPQAVGLLFVAIGAIASTIAWSYYRPIIAIGILMVFALADLVLYAVMPDVLVCYRCGARHGLSPNESEHPRFDLETAERYRQERLRLEQTATPKSP